MILSRCSSCQVVFGGLNSIKSHIQTAHCEVFHKCPSCPMAFKSSPSAQSHISTQHPTLTGGQAKYVYYFYQNNTWGIFNPHVENYLQRMFENDGHKFIPKKWILLSVFLISCCRMIYKCVMCDTVFTQKPLLYMHFDTHLAKQKVHVFKCPDCTKLYAQKGSMMEHIKVCPYIQRRVNIQTSYILDIKSSRYSIMSLQITNQPFAFMCCPFIAFYSECGVNKGIQQLLGSALARFLPSDLVLSLCQVQLIFL